MEGGELCDDLGKTPPGRRNSLCKGPKPEACLVCWRNSRCFRQREKHVSELRAER